MHATRGQNRALAEERTRAEAAQVLVLVDPYFDIIPEMTWQQVADDVFDRRIGGDVAAIGGGTLSFIVAHAYFRRRFQWQPGLFQDYWQWLVHGRIGPPPIPGVYVPVVPPPAHVAPVPTLQALAHDRQNVHTAVVSRQTNISTAKLVLAGAGVPAKARVPDWMAARWLLRSYGSWPAVRAVTDDVYKWYNTVSVRTTNDNLYRKMLNGLYETIRKMPNDDVRVELQKRVFEECRDAVGMCCEGHISRLCNVMVGFDEAFQSSVSLGELMQARMSVISQLEVETAEKVRQATAWFAENNVPEPERVAWLAAF
jgi:hypothetical protein